MESELDIKAAMSEAVFVKHVGTLEGDFAKIKDIDIDIKGKIKTRYEYNAMARFQTVMKEDPLVMEIMKKRGLALTPKEEEKLRTDITDFLKIVSAGVVLSIDFKAIAAALDFDNFDPAGTLSEFMTANANMTFGQFYKHIALSLVFFIVRGTNFEKAGLSEKSKDKQTMDNTIASIKRLGIKKQVSDKTSMTLPRLSSIFPHVVSIIASIVEPDPYGTALSPKYRFSHSHLIMTDVEFETNKDAYYGWCFQLNKRINSNNKARLIDDLTVYKAQQENIVKKARSGGFWVLMSKVWHTNFSDSFTE